jgi:hypothetical protein
MLAVAVALTAPLAAGVGVTPAAVLYYEKFEDTSLEADTTTNFATIAGGIASFNDASTTTRGRFVVRRPFDDDVMTFAFDTAAPVTNVSGSDNELIFRGGIGTSNNTLSSSEFIVEAVLFRTSGGGTGGGVRGDFLNNGNETMYLVANNSENPIMFDNPAGGGTITLNPFQYIPFIRNNDTGVFGTVKGVDDMEDRNGADPGPGTIIRFGIGNSSNGHQGTFAIDNVRVYSGVVLPEPSSLIVMMAGFLCALATLSRSSKN